MPESGGIASIRELIFEIVEASARTREIVAKSRDMLKTPAPDTFLGRRHHDVIPLPDEVEQGRLGWRPVAAPAQIQWAALLPRPARAWAMTALGQTTKPGEAK